MTSMRDLMTIVENAGQRQSLAEAVNPPVGYYLHVSPAANLTSIRRRGLQQPEGNYSGYETSLPGTYATRMPEIIHHHIAAREIEEHYVLAVLRVATPAFIDEDAMDAWLHAALRSVAAQHGISAEALIDQHAEEDDGSADFSFAALGGEMLPFMLRHLGPPAPGTAASIHDLLIEFCAGWIAERMVGDSIDGEWWAATKDSIVRAFPGLSHATHGSDYSIRIPSAVGYTGETRIVALIEVRDGHAQVVKGIIPPEAQGLVDATVGA